MMFITFPHKIYINEENSDHNRLLRKSIALQEDTAVVYIWAQGNFPFDTFELTAFKNTYMATSMAPFGLYSSTIPSMALFGLYSSSMK